MRWQVRKAAPFPIEESQVTYVPGIVAADGQDFVVSMARRAAVEEYEGLCAAAGAHAGLVDLATFNVINAVLAGAGTPSADSWSKSDWLLVNVAADYASIAIVRGGDLIFFRNRGSEGDGTLADLVHQTAMYYEDRLTGAGFARVILAGGGQPVAGDGRDPPRSLADRLTANGRTRWIRDPAAALTDRITAAPRLLDTLAPLVGILMRGREAAA